MTKLPEVPKEDQMPCAQCGSTKHMDWSRKYGVFLCCYCTTDRDLHPEE